MTATWAEEATDQAANFHLQLFQLDGDVIGGVDDVITQLASLSKTDADVNGEFRN